MLHTGGLPSCAARSHRSSLTLSRDPVGFGMKDRPGVCGDKTALHRVGSAVSTVGCWGFVLSLLLIQQLWLQTPTRGGRDRHPHLWGCAILFKCPQARDWSRPWQGTRSLMGKQAWENSLPALFSASAGAPFGQAQPLPRAPRGVRTPGHGLPGLPEKGAGDARGSYSKVRRLRGESTAQGLEPGELCASRQTSRENMTLRLYKVCLLSSPAAVLLSVFNCLSCHFKPILLFIFLFVREGRQGQEKKSGPQT